MILVIKQPQRNVECWSFTVLKVDNAMPEQRRVQAGSTVTLPCYAATSHSVLSDDNSHVHLRRRWHTSHGSDVTDRKLRHSRRANQRSRWRYEWRKDGKPIDWSGDKYSMNALDHTLTIRDVSTATDTAMYSCVRYHGNASHTDDVIASPHTQLVVEGKVF